MNRRGDRVVELKHVPASLERTAIKQVRVRRELAQRLGLERSKKILVVYPRKSSRNRECSRFQIKRNRDHCRCCERGGLALLAQPLEEDVSAEGNADREPGDVAASGSQSSIDEGGISRLARVVEAARAVRDGAT